MGSMKEVTNGCDCDPAGVRRAFGVITGKWKLEILWLLHQRVHRFGELKRALPGVSQHMLTTQLRELEADGLVSRQIFAEVPPRVEYALMPAALGLEPVMDALVNWCQMFNRKPASPKAEKLAIERSPNGGLPSAT